MNQRRLLPLLLLLLSIESVMSRALSSDDWQRLAGTGADVRSDAILPCVESGSCRGREFGSMSEDVSKFGNVPPCRFHGWVRCIQSAGPSIRDAAHGRQYQPRHQSVATPQYSHHQQNKDSLAQQSSSYSSQAPRWSAHQSTGEYGPHPSGKAAGQERRNERFGFVSTNTQRSLGHEQQQERRQPSLWQPKDEREMQEERRSALLAQHSAVVKIPKGAEWQGNHLMQGGAAVQFQQHPNSAAAADADAVLLPSVNMQPAELWGIQAGAQRSPSPESQGLTHQPIQRPVEFQHPHQPFEQSSQQLSKPSKFTQQQQLIQNELPGNNFVEPPPFSSQQSLNKQQQQQSAGQFRQLNTQPGQETFKTSSATQNRPDISGQQFVAEPRPFVKVNAMPVESQRLTSGTFFQQVPPRVEPIPSHSNPSFRLIEAGQQIIDPRRLVEPPPQRGAFEPQQQQQQQRFVQVNQPVTDPIKKEEPKQFASSQSTRQPQTLPQANQPLVQLQQQSARLLAGQQPIIADNHLRINQQQGPVTLQTGPLQQRPVEPQRSAEPRKLDPRPLVKSNSLGDSPQFIEPAKSSLGNLFEFDSSTDTQLAREQLAELIRLLAQSASQQQTDPNREATPNPSAPASSRQGESSNIVPFIAFSEPLPLEPASSNSLF